MLLVWDCNQSFVRHQTGAGVCSVPAADTVETGEVDCYNVVVLDSAHFHGLRIRSARGTVAQRNDHWLARMLKGCKACKCVTLLGETPRDCS